MLFFTKEEKAVIVGNEVIQPRPLGLEAVCRLTLLLGPYAPLLENHWPEFQRLLATTNGDRPHLLVAFFRTLASEIKPQDITGAFAILLDRPPEWFREVKPVELLNALPVLDEVNDFAGLFAAIRGLGLVVRYRSARRQNAAQGAAE
jgi:hypothetical protein